MPAENVMGKPGDGVRILMSGLDYERAVLAAGPLGIMQACLDVVLPYRARAQAIRRSRSAHSSSCRARSPTCMSRCRPRAPMSMRWRGPATAARPTRKDAAGAILYAAEKATWMALEAIQCLGGNGYINEYPDRPPAARRQALRDRRRHQRNPPLADRPRAVRGDRLA